jgi:hypothetical protein
VAKKKVPKRQPVTWRAMVQRVNRYLKPQGAQLRSSARGRGWNLELGPYYIVDDGKIEARYKTRREVAEFARAVGAIKDYEMVELADYEVAEKGGKR